MKQTLGLHIASMAAVCGEASPRAKAKERARKADGGSRAAVAKEKALPLTGEKVSGKRTLPGARAKERKERKAVKTHTRRGKARERRARMENPLLMLQIPLAM